MTSAPALSPPCAVTPPERCLEGDRFHDYVLSEYEPVAPPLGRLRSNAVLAESFALMGVEREGLALVGAVRRALGAFRSVWGVKHRQGEEELAWELYFYDFQRAHADLSVPSMIETLRPHLRVEAQEPHPLPWHMFSVELSKAHLLEGRAASVDLYIDMRSYKCSGDQLVFENVYTFHDAKKEIDEVLHRVRSCLHFDPARDGLHLLMPPHLFNCRKICVANKRSSDAMYFSRIGTPALTRFLSDQRWPSPLRDFVATRQDELSHLLWDVGVDFKAIAGQATPVKTGIYGSF